MCNYALHDLTLIKLIVTFFMGTGIFLIRYSVIQNKHIANWRCSMIVIKKLYFFN